MDLGVIQGRLSPPVDGHIQEFPYENWEREFNLLEQVGLSHIEWVITKESFDYILNWDVARHNRRISSICCDNLIIKTLTDKKVLSQQLRPICEWALNNWVDNITIPLLEDSALTMETLPDLIELFGSYGKVFPELNFNFEVDSNVGLAMWLVNESPNFYLVYDTGNITSANLSHTEWISKAHDKIRNVHLKDRTIDPVQTVPPSMGDTPFKLIFEELKKVGYTGRYTIQTARGVSGREVTTIKEHAAYFKNLYNE